MCKRLSVVIFKVLLLTGIILLSGCSTAVFNYDRAALPEAKPWTSENFENNPDNFQFAVIGDRTGRADHRGIFNRAMDQLNLLQPEFVINVGDAIEGYSEDRARLNAEWDEFKGIVKKLGMPFFYTVGNHDLNNDTMKRVWLERRGAVYYHFVYRDVLFLVLNSEDPPNALPKVPANFSDQQVAYVKKALAQNVDVRWTFLFLHQPAWEMPSENFLAIEQLLKDRDYTFIAGHLHYYNYEERHGRDYITMGPAGASFYKDGPGNVDHILWITVTGNGPQIAKITLDGIYDRKGRDLQQKDMYDRSNK